jgi:transmembrane sensor
MIPKSEILARFARNEASAEERAAFDEWLKTLSPAEVEALMDEYGELLVQTDTVHEPANAALLESIHREIAEPVRMSYWRWGQAAAVLLLIATGVYFWQLRQPVRTSKVVPGSQGATLTLADGTTISLDSAHAGTVAGTPARISGNNLIYDNNGKEAVYNIMSTSNGRQFTLVLPDGTSVWLNAASSIRYPTAFTGKERHVSVTGEAYFEVAQDAEKPFKVSVHDQLIEVLGTAFNVNAYNNEETISTTLLSGSVRVQDVIMKPGQQAQVSGQRIQLVDADAQQAIAWKKGLFNFENVGLHEAMRQLERWYDIRVVYEPDVPDIKLAGKMTRQVTLEGLLVVLEELGVHCRLDGRTLTISR